MTTIPRLAAPDSSASFLLDGYTFGQRRFAELGTDAFRGRLLLKPTTFLQGEEAVRVFYESGRFTRRGALPISVMHLLQDEGSVQTMDGAAHDHRKLMFIHSLVGTTIDGLRATFAREWDAAAASWEERDSIVLHDEMLTVLTRTALSWSGMPFAADDVELRTSELGDMVEHAGSFGPPNWAARVKRQRSERWAREVVRAARADASGIDPESAFAQLVAHRDEAGELLDEPTAAVELLNILRPIVAVGRFIVFAALALHVHPRWERAFAAGKDADLHNFVNEVRRYYPFFPVIAGRATESFDALGIRFEENDLVMVDLWATNHDARIWAEPTTFRPERFRDWNGNRNTLVPQGGGLVETGHRCPGEPITVELMKEAVQLLTRQLDYAVPEQDLRVSLRRFPAIPEDGFVMSGVSRVDSGPAL